MSVDDHGRTPTLVAVVGATATGKSALALDLAERLGGEIVGADASQLYRGMDIGTAKVPVDERRGLPHHQIDVLDIDEDASVAAYQRHCREDVGGIVARGRRPILVGGSGLYVRAAVDHLEIPPTDPAVRARLEAEAAELGTPTMLARLREVDPVAASRLEPNNTRRIVRALEVVELTGRPFSATMPRREYLRPTLTLGLALDRAVLDERIARRTAGMWADGLLDEVAALVGRGLSGTRTASRAVGYREALAELAGRMTRSEAIEATTTATRRLVRRQESWFRSDPRILWLDAAAPDLLDRALRAVAEHIADPV
ncbi:tRNA (adenosine(37)-N6)-dimethylallyltransferase MiaA [Mobilicoccus pelagius]|uniref:tRNA dimethylallyltransferase n=1 Tax=Mobilicoccus pelagius NBRC 104925 TaxID=1089455 RepID=H5UNT2_9MICO|nr:tRNA (adenosine(37)-N6)-dimethylallyltransferase MiaA [Mobilicoccus pelagius]GAB47390.1 tRNA dimethylallyltransferase [Mobilicoccus pelagius NBRC 104925]